VSISRERERMREEERFGFERDSASRISEDEFVIAEKDARGGMQQGVGRRGEGFVGAANDEGRRRSLAGEDARQRLAGRERERERG